jgi:hypothetical protein
MVIKRNAEQNDCERRNGGYGQNGARIESRHKRDRYKLTVTDRHLISPSPHRLVIRVSKPSTYIPRQERPHDFNMIEIFAYVRGDGVVCLKELRKGT